MTKIFISRSIKLIDSFRQGQNQLQEFEVPSSQPQNILNIQSNMYTKDQSRRIPCTFVSTLIAVIPTCVGIHSKVTANPALAARNSKYPIFWSKIDSWVSENRVDGLNKGHSEECSCKGRLNQYSILVIQNEAPTLLVIGSASQKWEVELMHLETIMNVWFWKRSKIGKAELLTQASRGVPHRREDLTRFVYTQHNRFSTPRNSCYNS